MKKVFFCLVLLFSISKIYSQQVVIDPAMIGTLWANHNVQNSQLNSIKSEQRQIKTYQSGIALKLAQIKALQDKAYKSLKNVQSVIRDGKNVIYASKIARDIGVYQRKMVDIARGNASLYLIAIKTELALINRTFDMYTYIATALKGGDINLMSNIDRMNIIQHVINELRLMRGMAYSITRKMRVAKYSGTFRALLNEYNINAFGFNKINRGGIVNDIMSDLK